MLSICGLKFKIRKRFCFKEDLKFVILFGFKLIFLVKVWWLFFNFWIGLVELSLFIICVL